jgi:hypothetical protein
MLVHNNEHQTRRLIDHLSNDFDVYVHIDKRSSLKINDSEKVFVYKKYKTYHASFNQIIATLYLLEKAFEKGYDRYILISGQDLPLKTNEEITDFFRNNNKEYIAISKIPTPEGWPDMNRLTAYNLSNIYRGINGKKIEKLAYKIVRKLVWYLSKIMPRKIDYDFYGGDNWTNYTHNCVGKIFEYIRKDKNYINRYRWTNCADEIFYQTIIAGMNDIEIEKNCLRYIDWESGPEYPKILREEDYQKVMGSNALFARKFDEIIDKNIIEKIYKQIKERHY